MKRFRMILPQGNARGSNTEVKCLLPKTSPERVTQLTAGHGMPGRSRQLGTERGPFLRLATRERDPKPSPARGTMRWQRPLALISALFGPGCSDSTSPRDAADAGVSHEHSGLKDAGP